MVYLTCCHAAILPMQTWGTLRKNCAQSLSMRKDMIDLWHLYPPLLLGVWNVHGFKWHWMPGLRSGLEAHDQLVLDGLIWLQLYGGAPVHQYWWMEGYLSLTNSYMNSLLWEQISLFRQPLRSEYIRRVVRKPKLPNIFCINWFQLEHLKNHVCQWIWQTIEKKCAAYSWENILVCGL